MNQVELLQGQLAALSRRVEHLEELARGNKTAGDLAAASMVAEKIGFHVEVLNFPRKIEERRKLADELRRRGWSLSRIARAFNCSERTVQRGFRH